MSDFIQFASSHGLIIKSLPVGKIVRCPTQAKPNKKNGAFLYDIDWGWVQDHQVHESPVMWLSGSIRDHIQLKKRIKESKAKYEVDKAKSNAAAAKKAQWILSQCELNLSPYLAKKGFPDMCGNIWVTKNQDRLLVIPMYKDKEIIGCQLISNDGNKKFLKDQLSLDAYFQIGNGNYTFFVEGYASGLSLQKVLDSCKVNYRILVTFSASNLLRFAKRIDGIVIADNDAESKTGEKAAMESGRKWWMPPLPGQDINDYCLAHGTFKPAMAIRSLIYSK